MSSNPEQDTANVDPDEIVSITGVGAMTLRAAVRRYVEARQAQLGVRGIVVFREAGEPPSFDERHLALLTERDEFR